MVWIIGEEAGGCHIPKASCKRSSVFSAKKMKPSATRGRVEVLGDWGRFLERRAKRRRKTEKEEVKNRCRCRWKQEMLKFRHSYATRPGRVTVQRLLRSNWSAGKSLGSCWTAVRGMVALNRGNSGKSSQHRVTESLPMQTGPMTGPMKARYEIYYNEF